MARILGYMEAINEAIDICLRKDDSVMLMGLGVPDPKGVFGTTLGLQEKYGENRVMDIPASENGVTGVAIGAALEGMRPILVHQRIDFALLSVDQIVNQAAKWFFMFGGETSVPVVIRLIVGRGWGQGPQHSQSLQSWFSHIPGLKVVMPSNPYNAKGLMISSVKDNNPVIFIEHRWLYSTRGVVPKGSYETRIGESFVTKKGEDITIAAISYMVIEALRAAEILEKVNVKAEVVDISSLRPFNKEILLKSISKTKNLITVDTGWNNCGFNSEILAVVMEEGFGCLKKPPQRLGLYDSPMPTSSSLSALCYPNVRDIIYSVCSMLDVNIKEVEHLIKDPSYSDIPPDNVSWGPF